MNHPPRSLSAALYLGLSVAVGHGIARFGYALIMPSMQAELGWGFERASWINTANALGYIAGTISGFFLLRRCSMRSLFRAGLWMTVASVPLMAVSVDFTWLLFLRVASGWGAAWMFSTGGALVIELFGADARRKGAATGLFFGGAGIGMMATGVTTPALLAWAGPAAWPAAWLLLGVLCLTLMILPLQVARGHGGPVPGSAAGAHLGLARNWLAATAYFGFAVSHTAYIFFVFSWTRTQQVPWFHGAGMWTLLGAAVLGSAFLWQRALANWPAQRTMALCFVVCGAGSVLPVLSPSPAVLYASAALVGGSMFIGPASMTSLVRQTLMPAVWGKAMMVYSLVFALGQAVGSWAAGRVADTWGPTIALGAGGTGLLISALLVGVASAGRRSADAIHPPPA